MVEFGSQDICGVKYCKRCGHIVDFPYSKVSYNAYVASKLKMFNFRVVKRDSKHTGKVSYGIRDVEREDVPNCRSCWNHRGIDCDEHWKKDSCELLFCHFIAPFTVCDLYKIHLRRIRVLPDGGVEAIPEYCYRDTWMSLEDAKKWNEERERRKKRNGRTI